MNHINLQNIKPGKVLLSLPNSEKLIKIDYNVYKFNMFLVQHLNCDHSFTPNQVQFGRETIYFSIYDTI